MEKKKYRCLTKNIRKHLTFTTERLVALGEYMVCYVSLLVLCLSLIYGGYRLQVQVEGMDALEGGVPAEFYCVQRVRGKRV